MDMLSLLGLGLLLGVRHATDADHVVAVTAILTREKKIRFASLIGAIWGIGHTLTIVIVGSAIILFHIVIPPRIGLLLEFLVALALITLGALNLSGLLTKIIRMLDAKGQPHAHIHLHGGEPPHIHMHTHEASMPENHGAKVRLSAFIRRFGIFQLARPFIVGLIHGLAGSAAIALLILGTISDPQVAIWYLMVFGVGTIIGMMTITTLIGLPIIASSKRFRAVDRYINTASGLLSLLFGLYLAYQIGLVDGLFSAAPQWDPH